MGFSQSASSSLNSYDTTRAIRNARLLRSFTGRKASAFVAGLHRDDRVLESIDAGEVVWFELEPSGLEAD